MISLDTLSNLLPNPPDDYTYELIQQSPQIIAVWLCHPDVYHYTEEPVKTIHSFIKNDKVHAPLNHTKPRKDALCPVTQLFTLSPYSVIIPKTRSLLHL